MHRIDDSFRQKKEAAARARRNRRLKARLKTAGLALGLMACGVAGVWYWQRAAIPPSPKEPAEEVEPPPPAFASVIVDLPGDPLRIEIAGGDRSALALKPAPPEAAGVSGTLSILSETILPSSQKLVTAIPSTPQDFAFFQAQRSGGVIAPDAEVELQPAPETEAEAEPEAPVSQDMAVDDDGEGEGEAAAQAPAEPASREATGSGGWSDIETADLQGSDGSFRKTEIEDNTTTVMLIADRQRGPRTEDDFRRVIAASPVAEFLGANGVSETEAKIVAASLKASAGLDALPAGSLVAMRFLNDRSVSPPTRRLAQAAFYEPEKFLGALAIDSTGAFAAAADPWVATNLFKLLDEPQQNVEEQRYRLLDGIYSVGLRNGISTSIIGEAIMYLSRGHDLGEFANRDDKLTLVYSETGREAGGVQNRVLYIGIEGPNVGIRCFVYKPEGANDFSCLDENDRSGTVEITNGMVTPVAGVMTSAFGPRRHPILGKVLMHQGVDWAAPVGTPIRAAFAGKISYAGEKGTFGNFVQIEHGGGRATGYAHMNALASGVKVGAAVKAGDVIGYIGTTGRSTGPHLHFEMYMAGKPIDPLQTAVASSDSGGEAVELLVDRIVHVESGGNASAKNPLSTATGLGQFIESTWLRMMRTYRPDLATSLGREQLLALRLDPTLSREMVTNLARENKSYLEAGGQAITAGRLYLAHFLGPEGARTVLASADGDMLETVLGSAVIRANPFLTGKDVSYVKNWAEQKMRHRRGGGAAAPVTVTKKVEEASPEFLAYRKAMLTLVSGEIAAAPAVEDPQD